MSQLTIVRVTELLRAGLRRPLPGFEAQARMAPAHRNDLVRINGSGLDAREAAVLVVIAGSETPKLVLTQRRPNLKYHPGQISFPGGRREPDESLLETALRETEEEVDLPRENVTVIGSLSPLYVPPSRFRVHPFVGVVGELPSLLAADDEVSRIILADLQRLCDPLTRSTEVRTIRGREVSVPYFDLDGDKIWGATAMIIAELVEVLAC